MGLMGNALQAGANSELRDLRRAAGENADIDREIQLAQLRELRAIRALLEARNAERDC